MVIATDPAYAAGDEVTIPRVFVLHEDRVAAEDRRRAMTFEDLLRVEIDFCVDAEAADDSRDRIPRHLNDIAPRSGGFFLGRVTVAIFLPPNLAIGSVVAGCVSGGDFTPPVSPPRLFVD